MRERGGALIVVLVFASIFLVSVSALMQFIFQQTQLGRGKIAREEALQIAEGGLEYYKWYLAHNPESTAGGTFEYRDPISDERRGEFIIAATSTSQCGEIQYRDVEVIGTADSDMRYPRTISARYMQPSVANYSYIIGANVWSGSGRTIVGPYYSTGGIHMDGTHNSLVVSGVDTWSCTSSFGCSPTQEQPGVWGAGSNPELWQYPVDLVSFDDLTVDFNDLRAKAQSGGRYFSSVTGGLGDGGYHLIFKSDGTFDVYRVDTADEYWGLKVGGIADSHHHGIVSETFIGNYTVPGSCSLIFVEDQVWLEGEISGKAALVVADTVHSFNPDVVLHDDLAYASGPETDALTVMAEGNILVSAVAPDTLTVSGVFVAPNGKFGRQHYVENTGVYYTYDRGWIEMEGTGSHQDLDHFTINGTVISGERVGLQWGYGIYRALPDWPYYTYEYQESGFAASTNSYQRVLALDPPPFTPPATTTPYIVNWREE